MANQQKPPQMEVFDVKKLADDIIEIWHNEVNLVAMMSLDPEYVESLNKRSRVTRVMAELMSGFLVTKLEEAYRIGRDVTLRALRLAAEEYWENSGSGSFMPFSGTDEQGVQSLVDRWIKEAEDNGKLHPNKT